MNLAAPSTPHLAIADGVATITLNRPAHRNRLQEEDLDAMLALCARIDADASVRVAVLRANTAGQPRPVFCAGYDLGGFEQSSHGPHRFERMADAWAALRPVTVCALGGSVYGGATDLFVSSDLRIARDDVELRMPAAALGLHYYPGGLQRYVARMGMGFAKRAFLTARPFTAQQLWEAGALEALVPPDRFEAELAALLQDLAGLAPLAVQFMKRSIDELGHGRADPAAMRERELAASLSADFAEGRRAFAERRKPRFNGR